MSLPVMMLHASPINQLIRRQTASYSVVAVDGGPSGAAATTTVTEPASTLPPTTKFEVTTLFSTIVLTEIPTPTTIVLTITSTASMTYTETPATTPSDAAAPPFRFSTITISPSYTIPSAALSPVTVTVAASSVPYDDGMWHTTYYHPVAAASTTAASAAPSSTAAAAANFVASAYNETSFNYTAPPPLPEIANLTLPLNWTSPLNYTNARFRS